MSLIKQLWIAILFVTLLAFGGSLVISTLSARHYLEQQLHVKNIDNAASLALSLSQLPKDAVTIELMVSAQFDTGHYQSIQLLSPEGDVLVAREYRNGSERVPGWFTQWIPIEASPGLAQVQDGWHQYGTLVVESHSRFAYDAMWQGIVLLLAWFGAGAIGTGTLATLLLRHVIRPLDGVVAQAEAIGGRRFVTTDEPRTAEFKTLVRAMNRLSERVRNMLSEETRRLEELRRRAQHDELTGLLNRDQFMNLLASKLRSEDSGPGGCLAIARVEDLLGVNRRIGRHQTDELLRELANSLQNIASPFAESETGRINGSDFVLLAPRCEDPQALAPLLDKAFNPPLSDGSDAARPKICIGIVAYQANEPTARVLARMDGALAHAEQGSSPYVLDTQDAGLLPLLPDLVSWREALQETLSKGSIRLDYQPVVDRNGQRLHKESLLRVQIKGSWHNAGMIMPWAQRLGLTSRIDLSMIRMALDHIEESQEDVCVNVSVNSVTDATFVAELSTTLSSRPQLASHLWLEIPEIGVIDHSAPFRSLCLALKPLHCHIGIEHAGKRFGQLEGLHDLGLDYIKIDASLMNEISKHHGNQVFVRGLCVVAHAIGLKVIGESGTGEDSIESLWDLGLDGACLQPLDPESNVAAG